MAHHHYDERARRHEEIAEDEETLVVRRVNNFAKQAMIACALDALVEEGVEAVQVLDLGCGRGQDLHKIARKTRERDMRLDRYTGLDASPASIREAQERLATAGVAPERCRFLVRDLNDAAPLPPYNLALLHFCINYMVSPEALLRSLYDAAQRAACVSIVYADGNVIEASRCGVLAEAETRFRVRFGRGCDPDATGAGAGEATGAGRGGAGDEGWYRFYLGRSVEGAPERLAFPSVLERAARTAGFAVLAHVPLTQFVRSQLELVERGDRREDWAHMTRGLRIEERDWRTTGCYRALLLSKSPRAVEAWLPALREHLESSV